MAITGLSVYERILEGVRDAVRDAQLDILTKVETRIVGKFFDLPLDQLPITIIAHGDPDQTERASFEAHRTKTFEVYVATLGPLNQDFASQSTYLLWREKIENVLDPPDDPILPGVTDQVVDVVVLPQEVLDSRLAGRGYGYTGFAVRYTVTVERTRG